MRLRSCVAGCFFGAPVCAAKRPLGRLRGYPRRVGVTSISPRSHQKKRKGRTTDGLPRRALSPSCRTALALRYLGGGSYVDIRAVLCLLAARLSRSFWDEIHAIYPYPSLDLDLQLSCRQLRLDFAGGFRRRRRSPFGNEIDALDGVVILQEQPLASDVKFVSDEYSRTGFYAFNIQQYVTRNTSVYG